MKLCFLIFLYISSCLASDANNKLFYLNFGGYTVTIPQEHLILNGGDYFANIIKYYKPDDQEIFIARPKEEGKIISYFLLTNELPGKYDPQILLNAADYFLLETLKTLHQQKYRYINITYERCFTITSIQCPHCHNYNDHYHYHFNIETIQCFIKHLVRNHDAKISLLFPYNYACKDYYIKYDIKYLNNNCELIINNHTKYDDSKNLLEENGIKCRIKNIDDNKKYYYNNKYFDPPLLSIDNIIIGGKNEIETITIDY